MKTVTLYRQDFKKSAEADFFEDVLQSLGIEPKLWDEIDEVDMRIDSALFADESGEVTIEY